MNLIGEVGCFGVNFCWLNNRPAAPKDRPRPLCFRCSRRRGKCDARPEQVRGTATLPAKSGPKACSHCTASGVANDLRIGVTALGANFGGDVIGFAPAGAVIKVVADRRKAVMGELADCPAITLIQSAGGARRS